MSRVRFLGSMFMVPALVAAFAVGCGGNDKKTEGPAAEKKTVGTKSEKKESGSTSSTSEKTPIKATALTTIKGKVTFDGAVPAPATLNFEGNQNKDHCLKGPKEDPTWIVDKDSKGVKNVVIWLRAPAGKFFELPPDQQKPAVPVVKIDQPFCAFEPHVAVAFPSFYDAESKKQKKTGQELVVDNSAPIAHNTNYTPTKPLLDSGDNLQLSSGKNAKISLFDKQTDRAGNEDIISLKCNIHTWMRGYVVALDHPYVAITNDKGEYEIKNVPADADLLIVGWHEAAEYFLPEKAKGEKVAPLKANDTKELSFTIKK